MKLSAAILIPVFVALMALPAAAEPVIKAEDLSVSSQTDPRLGSTTGQVAAAIALAALLIVIVNSDSGSH
jgi:hypothetical protein